MYKYLLLLLFVSCSSIEPGTKYEEPSEYRMRPMERLVPHFYKPHKCSNKSKS